MRRVGLRVRRARKLRRLSQEELAEGVGITRKHLSNIENAKVKNLTATTLFRLCVALNINIEFLQDPVTPRELDSTPDERLANHDAANRLARGLSADPDDEPG